MGHTVGCAGAKTPQCRCPCDHALHGATSGVFSTSQKNRARDPVYAAAEARWPKSGEGARDNRVHRVARNAAKDEILRLSTQASETLAAGMIRGDVTHELVTVAVEELMAYDHDSGRKARKKATEQLELHVLCTLFWVCHQALTGIESALSMTVEELINEALGLPERPKRSRG